MDYSNAKLNELSPLRWCFSSMGCAELNLSQIAELAAKYGVPEVELRAASGKIALPALAKDENWLATAPEQLLGHYPVKVFGLNASARLSKPFEECLPEIAGFAPIMAHFGATSLRVFDGDIDLINAPDSAWAWLDSWEQARAANGWNFSLGIETHDALFTAEEAEKLFSKGHPHATLLWDSHHTWRKKGLNPLKSWPELKPWTTHIHIKDSTSVPSAKLPYTYVNPGQGEFPLAQLLNQLETDKFSGPVSLEWEKLWHPAMGPLPDALQALSEVVAKR